MAVNSEKKSLAVHIRSHLSLCISSMLCGKIAFGVPFKKTVLIMYIHNRHMSLFSGDAVDLYKYGGSVERNSHNSNVRSV